MLSFALNVEVYLKQAVFLRKMVFEKHFTIHQACFFLSPDSFCYGTSSSTSKIQLTGAAFAGNCELMK